MLSIKCSDNSLHSQGTACPVCRGMSLDNWGISSGYSLYLCKECSHRFADVRGYISENEDPDKFRNSFTHGLMSSDISYYNHLCSGEYPGCPTMVTTEHLLRLCQKLTVHGGRWLDVGCGSGYLLEQVQRHGWDAVGLEPGGWGQIAAKERGLNVIQAYLSKHTFETKFDIVSATDVLEHQPDPESFLRLLWHHACDNGYVIISIPCSDSLACRISGTNWSMVAPPTHCQFFSRKSIDLLALNSGFNVVSLRQYSVLHLMGAMKYGIIRVLIDAVLNITGGGDQALVILQKTSHKDIRQ